MNKVVIRNFQPASDSGFIYSTLPKNAYYSAYHEVIISRARWFKEIYNYLKEVIEVSKIFIACPEGDMDTIVGYSIINQDVLEFVFVKDAYRKQGVGTLLVKGRGVRDYNLLTKIGKSILDNHKDLFEETNKGERNA